MLVHVNFSVSHFSAFDAATSSSASAASSSPSGAVPLEVHNELAYLEAPRFGMVGDRIESAAEKAEARRRVVSVFGEAYVYQDSAVDLDDSIDSYNMTEAFRRVTFLDWYTLHDYKCTGYRRVNRPLKNLYDAGHAQPGTMGTPLGEEVQKHVIRLSNVIRQAGAHPPNKIQSDSIDEQQLIVFSGTDMSLAALKQLEPGTIYEYPAFLSTTIDEDVAEEFVLAPQDPHCGRAAVMYQIELAPESKALDLSSILGDGEEEVLFPPGTRFVVDSIREARGVFRVSLSEIY